MKINVNGKEIEIHDDVLKYENVVKLAGMTGMPSMTFLMKFKDEKTGRTIRDEGILAPGEVLVSVREGAVFTVCHTNNA